MAKRNQKIEVQVKEVIVAKINEQEFISLTDIASPQDLEPPQDVDKPTNG